MDKYLISETKLLLSFLILLVVTRVEKNKEHRIFVRIRAVIVQDIYLNLAVS